MFEEEIICESCEQDFQIRYYSEDISIYFCPFCGNKIDTFDLYEFTSEDDD